MSPYSRARRLITAAGRPHGCNVSELRRLDPAVAIEMNVSELRRLDPAVAIGTGTGTDIAHIRR
jgi:hypothetical protein